MFWDTVKYDRVNEAEIIENAKKGDFDAFSILVLAHREAVMNMVYRMCGDQQLAEDATQEAFIRCWQNLPRYQAMASFRAWLFRIALNAAYDTLRREKNNINIDDFQIGEESKVEQMVEKEQDRIQLQKAVLRLPSASRIVIILREYEQMSYQEIAETLEIPIGTVMSRLNYARNCLLKELSLAKEEL